MVCARLWPLSEPSLESQANSLSPLSHHARSPSYLGNCNVHSVCGDLLQRLLLPSCPLSCPLLIRPPGSMPRTQRLWDRSSEFFGIYPSLTMVSSIYTLMSEYCPCASVSCYVSRVLYAAAGTFCSCAGARAGPCSSVSCGMVFPFEAVTALHGPRLPRCNPRACSAPGMASEST